jgi:hypothetical protein
VADGRHAAQLSNGQTGLFSSRSGVFIGSQRVSGALELGGSGDQFASRSAIEILDDHDNVIAMGCAAALGTRFE